MKRALSTVLILAGCAASTPTPSACDSFAWIDETDPPAIVLRATGAVTWDASDPPAVPLTFTGTLVDAREGALTTLEIETSAGTITLEVGLALSRLGRLPIGEVVELTLENGLVLTNAEGRLETAVVSRRGSGEVVAGSVTFRQSYAECAGASMDTGCWRVVASPLVDVVTGASVIRVPSGGVWRIPNDEAPTAEIEIVRSARGPEAGDELDVPSPLCLETPAQEIAAIIRHLP